MLPLDDDRALDPTRCGNKAATLARLRRAGFAVPDGFVLTDEALPNGALGAALTALGGPVAVRSSSPVEDLPERSSAGRYLTVLAVEGADAVREAVRKCRESGGPAMPVLVQRMVPADVAGVAFSADPITGERERARVSAVRGLGDRLVGGAADPDECVVHAGGTEVLATAEGVLTAAIAMEVAGLARRLEAHLGHPVDVEWALAGQELHVLQARPITALPTPPTIEVPPGTWQKDLAHYPDLVDAYTASLLEVFDEPVAAMCAEFGLMVERVESRSFGGEVYTRAVPLGGSDGPAPPWWVLAIVARLLPAMRRRLAAADRAVASGLLDELPRRWEREWRDELRAEIERLRRVPLQLQDDLALGAHVDAGIALLARGAVVHFRLFVPYLDAVHGLVDTCRELLGWDAPRALELLAGTSTASSEPGRDLLALAELARGRTADDPELARAFAGYLDRHGLRSLGYTVGAPTLAERPDWLASLVRDAVATAVGTGISSVAERRTAAIALARGRVDPRSLERFDRALERAERIYPVREDNVHWTTTVPLGLVRGALLEIGRRLRARGALEEATDVVELGRAEVKDAVAGTLADARPLVRRRKAERAWVAAHRGAPVLGPAPSAPPDLRGLPAAARRLNGALLWAMALELAPPRAGGGALRGLPGSPGRYRGPVRLIRTEEDFGRLRPGDVLVCPIATPSWSVLFPQAGAIVTDGGGPLSHAAIVAREHGIPAVLGTASATRELRDGETVVVDGATGTVDRS